MKSVFTSREIAHIWAHKGAPRGRSPGNLSFDGDAISSYGTVIGRRISARGKEAYVLDRASFSVSTSKSQGRVASAIPGDAQVFNIRNGERGQFLYFTPAALAKWFEDAARQVGEELPSRYARIRAEQYQNVTAHLRDAREVLAFFGLGTARLDAAVRKRVAGEATAADTLKIAREKKEAGRIAREKRQAQERAAANIAGARDFVAGKRPDRCVDLEHRQAALDCLPDDLRRAFVAAVAEHNAAIDANAAKENAEKIAAWLAGEPVYLPQDCPTMLRVEAGDSHPGEGPEMVTSHGARVPLSDARRTYRFAMLARAKGWHKNGERCPIGAYELDSVNDAGVIAGCHRVTWAEIERFAGVMGWAK